MFKMASQAPMYDQNAVQPMRDALIAVSDKNCSRVEVVRAKANLQRAIHTIKGELHTTYRYSCMFIMSIQGREIHFK